MAFRDDNNLLFYRGDLPDALRQHLKSVDAAVDELAEGNRSHPLKKSRQPDDLYGIVAELADDLTDATRCT